MAIPLRDWTTNRLKSAIWGSTSTRTLTSAATVINSIQYGTVALTNGSTSATATITSVDTSKAVLINLGYTVSEDTAKDALARLSLTNSTTVTATRGASVNTCTVGFCVVEFV